MGWSETRLKHLAAIPITNGLGEAGTHDNPAWPRYVRTTDIAGPRALRTDVFASLPPETAEKAMIVKGDILATAAGATIGKTTTYSEDGPACYAGFLVRFRPGPEVEGRFIAYWMQSAPYWDQVNTGAVRSTIDNFSASKYQNLRIALPPLAQQRHIADFLDFEVARLDRALELRQAQLDLLAERVASYTCQVLAQREEPRVPLRYLAPEIVVGIVVQPASYYTEDHDGVPAVRALDVQAGRINTENLLRITPEGHALHKRSQLRDGDVMVVRTGDAGVAAVVPPELVGANCVSNVVVRVAAPLTPKYLELWLNSHEVRGQIERQSVGAIQQHFGVGAMKQLVVPLLSGAEYAARADMAASVQNDAERLSALLTTSRTLLAERKTSLITAAVTGQFDVATARPVAVS